MHLQSRQIEAFRAVMTTGSVTTAAESAGVRQAAGRRLIGEFAGALACPGSDGAASDAIKRRPCLPP